MTKKIVALAGDGIGPEIMEAGLAVLEAVAGQVGFDYEIEERAFGGAGIDAAGHPLPDATLQACRQADAILLAISVALNMMMRLFDQNKVCFNFGRNWVSLPISVRSKFLIA